MDFSFSDAKVEALFDGAHFAAPLALANPNLKWLSGHASLPCCLVCCLVCNITKPSTKPRASVWDGSAFWWRWYRKLNQVDTLAMVAVGALIQNNIMTAVWWIFDLKMTSNRFPRFCPVVLSVINVVSSRFTPGQSADVTLSGKVIGWLGQLHPQIAKALDLPTSWVAQLNYRRWLTCTAGIDHHDAK